MFSNLSSNKALISLDISNSEHLSMNRLGAAGAGALKAYLASNKIIQFLNLSKLKLQQQQVQVILSGIEQTSNLLELNISHNQLGPLLGANLRNCVSFTALFHLDLSAVQLED